MSVQTTHQRVALITGANSNNHTGFLTVAQGAAIVVRLATLGADGPTGGFFSEEGTLPW